MSWARRAADFRDRTAGGIYAVAAAVLGLSATTANAQVVQLPICTEIITINCQIGGIIWIVPEVPAALGQVLGEDVADLDVLGLVYREAAALSQLANTTASVAFGLTQDVISNVLDPAVASQTFASPTPFGAASPGSASSLFMVSGYKHLSHDGYSVASNFGPAAGKSPGFDEDDYGLTLGTRFDGSELFGSEQGSFVFGVLGNYTHTDIDVDVESLKLPGKLQDGSASIDSWSVGGYGLFTDGTQYGLVTLTGTFGSPETENALAATADYGTFGLAASAVGGVLVPVGSAKLDLRGGLSYLHASSDDHTDSLGSRYTDGRLEDLSGSLSARLFSVVRAENYTVRPFVQGGVNQRFHYENEITVDDATFHFDDADTSVFGRAGIDFDVDQAIQAYLSVRGDASEDVTAIAAQVGLTFKLD